MSTQLELGEIQFLLNLSCLYPTYIRCEAYLAAGQGKEAGAEFHKIIDHSGIVWELLDGSFGASWRGPCPCTAIQNLASSCC